MTELDQAIEAAFASEGKQDDVNKVYLTLLRTMLFVPVSKEKPAESEELFQPLFAKIEENYFMLGFDSLDRLMTWVGDEKGKVDYVEISGRDVIAGINENVFLCINVGTSFYKEFSPDEIKRLKMIVARIDQMKGS